MKWNQVNSVISKENVSLIKEINDLRRELKMARMRLNDIESSLGKNPKTTNLSAQKRKEALVKCEFLIKCFSFRFFKIFVSSTSV